MLISEKQINFIEKDLRKRGLRHRNLRAELLDHICCAVEQEILKNCSFEEAYQNVLNAFGENGLKNTEKTTLKFVKPYKKQITPMGALMTSMLACVLVFVIFINTDTKAQVRPEIMPVKQAATITADTYEKQTHFSFMKKETTSIKDETKFHNGVDFHVPVGTPILATAKGEVIELEQDKIIIKHNESYNTLYSKLSNFAVRKGEKVKKGQIIAYSAGVENAYGETIISYKVFKNGKATNPFLYFEEVK